MKKDDNVKVVVFDKNVVVFDANGNLVAGHEALEEIVKSGETRELPCIFLGNGGGVKDSRQNK